MHQENIENIIKMRLAVYKAGVDAQLWNEL